MYESTDYKNLALAERCNAIREARELAVEDETERPDWTVVCFRRGDPRRDAYINERNRIRVAAGHRRLVEAH